MIKQTPIIGWLEKEENGGVYRKILVWGEDPGSSGS
jgi:hypothetical protein